MAKIGFIISSLFACGGEERVVSLIANELSYYHDITIYTYENRRAEGGRRNDYYLSDKIRVEEVDSAKETFFKHGIKLLYHFTGMTSGRISQYFLKQTFYPEEHLNEWIERINREKFDLMIAVSGSQTILLGYIRNKIGAKCIGWEHSSFEGYFDRKTGYYRNRMEVYRECAAKMEKIVVLNPDIATKYEKKLGLRAMVIPDPRSFSSKEKADVKRQCFVSCGRVEKEKGFDDLIEAFAAFDKKTPGWELLIIGGGSMEKQLNAMITEKHLQGKVRITGYIHEVKENLLKGSVYIMTSRWEGFGMAVVEAMEVGLPVIAYGIPAMKSLVSDGKEGRIVPAFEQDKLVEAMIEIAAQPEERKRMSENVQAKSATLDPKNIVAEWLKVIDEVVERK